MLLWVSYCCAFSSAELSELILSSCLSLSFWSWLSWSVREWMSPSWLILNSLNYLSSSARSLSLMLMLNCNL